MLTFAADGLLVTAHKLTPKFLAVRYNRSEINVLQNSFHATSDNPEILIIWHLRRAVPRPVFCSLLEKIISGTHWKSL